MSIKRKEQKKKIHKIFHLKKTVNFVEFREDKLDKNSLKLLKLKNNFSFSSSLSLSLSVSLFVSLYHSFLFPLFWFVYVYIKINKIVVERDNISAQILSITSNHNKT